MHCPICTRTTHALACATCVNTTLWPKRYESILVNTEKERLQDVVDNYRTGTRQRLTEAIVEAKEQHRNLERIEEKHRVLKQEVKQGKARIAALRTQNESRRVHLDERNHGLKGRRGNAEDVLQRETVRLQQKWNLLSSRMAEARSFLCHEASVLYGLRKLKNKGGKVEIMLGGVAVPNLADINTMHTAQTTTALGYISHLLVLIAHYLSIKLPNEITLPSRSSPYTTIKNRTSTKLRPLHIPAPLSQLARDNHEHYTFFLDAYAMLCHNISFVCYTQGLVIANIEEVCRPAECLYRLLILREVTAPANPSVKPIKFGDYSHGTAKGYLGRYEGHCLLKGWHVSLSDCQEKVRNTITGDGVGLEWDIVDVEESVIGPGPLAETAFGGDGGWMKIRGGRRQ